MQTITIGDKQYPAQPLNFRQLRELAAEINFLTGILYAREKGTATPLAVAAAFASEKGAAAVMAVVGASLKRGDAGVDMSVVEEALDISNAVPVIGAALNLSGLEIDPKKAAATGP